MILDSPATPIGMSGGKIVLIVVLALVLVGAVRLADTTVKQMLGL